MIKKDGLIKRLENIKDNEEQLQAILRSRRKTIKRN